MSAQKGQDQYQRRATEERRQRLLELHRKGCTPPQIAERLGMRTNTIRKLLRIEGVQPHPGGLDE